VKSDNELKTVFVEGGSSKNNNSGNNNNSNNNGNSSNDVTRTRVATEITTNLSD
jgi:hypothetical protein